PAARRDRSCGASFRATIRVVSAVADPSFEQLLEYVRDTRGFDFTAYKRPSLQRRFKRRLDAVGAKDFTAYREVLDENEGEYQQLFDTILINVTGFFRDAEA